MRTWRSWRFSPPKQTLFTLVVAVTMHSPRRSQRTSKRKKFCDDEIYDEEAIQKVTAKTESKRRKGNALQPVPVKSEHTTPALDPLTELIDQPLPRYTPPFSIPLIPVRPRHDPHYPLRLFLKFLDRRTLETVASSTNAKAVAERRVSSTGLWYPTNANKLLKWLRLRLYMARHTEATRQDYWKVSIHNLGRYMHRERWL